MQTPFLRRPTLIPAWLGLLGCVCIPAAGSARSRADVLQPLRVQAVQSPQVSELLRKRAARRATLPEFLHDTRRNPDLLRYGVLTRSRDLAVAAKASRATLAAADSVCRVLLVRVGFESNREPSLTSMHPSGDFFLEPDPTVAVDPPPHDVAYFEALLLAMDSYYRKMSSGRFRLDSRVFPGEGQPSIKLSDVADYGPGSRAFWTLEKLETYFRDAIMLLDREAAGILDLSTFDSIILMHPGSDLQNDINQDSPNDLPTFFITLGDSIAVQNGTHEIRNGLVMPESVSQDGALGGVLGALSHEFGHQLGLPDWYNTFSGIPVVGEWSLMDSGNAAFYAFQVDEESEPVFALGILPTSLTAYDRYLLGWEQPYVVEAPEDEVTLRPLASTLPDPASGQLAPTSAILPVSPEEYFIVENRRDLMIQRPDLGESESCPYFNSDPETGVILWFSKSDTTIAARERRNSGEYDFFIPAPSAPDEAFGDCGEVGFGLLVWHVDERKLFEGYQTNIVNIDRDYLALRLIEASGDYEIGDLDQPSLGFLGDGWNDPFRRHPLVSYTELRENTVPNNWNSDWARTGWEIDDVIEAAPESHTLRVRMLDGVAGWPLYFGDESGALLWVEPEGAVIAEVAGRGRVLVVADTTGVYAFAPTGGSVLHPAPIRATSLAFARELRPGDAVGTLAALDSTSVWLWSADARSGQLQPLPGFPLALPGGAGERVVLLEGNAAGLAETATGDWILFDPQAGILATFEGTPDLREASPVAGVFDAQVGLEIALVSADRVSFESAPGLQTAATLTTAPATLQRTIPLDLAPAPAADLLTAGGPLERESGTAQLVVLHRGGRLRVIDPVRGLLRDYPDLPRDDYISLALADLNGDGDLDVIATSAQRIIAINSRGARLLNTPFEVENLFALRSAGNVVTAPVIADLTGDALPEIGFVTDLGLVYVVDAEGKLVPGYPRKALADLLPAAVFAADLDGNATTRELLALGPVGGVVFAPAGGDLESPGWTSEAADAARSRFVTQATAVPGGERLLALERPFQAYPNPSRESRIHLRITARTAGPFEVRIYNLEGEQVFEHRGVAHAGTQEVVWQVDGLASGVYLCRFVSAAAGVSSPLIEPITLVR